MDTLSRRADAACRIAREAGRLARGYFDDRGKLTIEAKGRQDLVSEADRATEAFIRRELRSRFAEDAILGEEEGGEEAPSMWIVDPIDGTSNFLRGVPYWCVVIAYAAGGATEIGVTYDPLRDALYLGRRGEGAWKDGAPIEVAGRGVESACAALSFNFKNDPGRYAELVADLSRAGIDHRRTGSTALNLALTAEGVFDAALAIGCSSWDAAAGLCLVEAAGGVATRWPLGEWGQMRAMAGCTQNLRQALEEAAGFDVVEGGAAA